MDIIIITTTATTGVTEIIKNDSGGEATRRFYLMEVLDLALAARKIFR
jgi:hypothetical protein